MRTEKEILVLKFGSSVLQSDDDLPAVVQEIRSWCRRGRQVVAVVSAFGNTTNELSRRAHRVAPQPNDELVAALLATGETAASALLGLALNQAGLSATTFDVFQAGLRTVGPTLDAELIGLDLDRISRALRKGAVVLPGFIGLGDENKTTLLGRGGSDLTALFIAQQLRSDCRLIKDVDGLYTSDPNSEAGCQAARFERVSYATALSVGNVVVQKKAIDFAQTHHLQFSISSIGTQTATEVGSFEDCIFQTLEDAEERAA